MDDDKTRILGKPRQKAAIGPDPQPGAMTDTDIPGESAARQSGPASSPDPFAQPYPSDDPFGPFETAAPATVAPADQHLSGDEPIDGGDDPDATRLVSRPHPPGGRGPSVTATRHEPSGNRANLWGDEQVKIHEKLPHPGPPPEGEEIEVSLPIRSSITAPPNEAEPAVVPEDSTKHPAPTAGSPEQQEGEDRTRVLTDPAEPVSHPSGWAPQPDPALHWSHPPIQAGDTLNNRFRLEKAIAAGGMGVVYQARDLVKEGVGNSQVALKMLGEGFKGHSDAWKTLLIEMENTRKLRHPNIIEVYDFDHDVHRDEYFMTMEYLEGQSLEDWLREHRGQSLPPAEVYRIIGDIVSALDYAHRQTPAIVHSDIKPGNIFLTRDGRVKVLDFGIARVKQASELLMDEEVKDERGFSAYSIPYASCEIMEGWPPDPRDDVYALACITYRMFTGRHPFGAYGARYARDAGLTPEPIPALSKRQWKALRRALAFARKDRTKTVTQFLAEMKPPSRTRQIQLASALGAAALLIAVLLVWPDREPAPPVGSPTLTAPLAPPVLTPQPPLVTTAPNPLPPPEPQPEATLVEPPPVEPVIKTLTAEQQLVEWLPSLDTVPLTLLKHDFRKGEAIPLRVTLAKPSYLHIFFFQPGEPVVLVYPNAKAPDNRLPPGSKAIEKLIAMPPYGQSWFIAVAETQASNLLRDRRKDKAVIQQGYAIFTADQLLGILRKKSLSPEAALGHVDMNVVE